LSREWNRLLGIDPKTLRALRRQITHDEWYNPDEDFLPPTGCAR
jgi:hypothetical protein